MLNHPKSLFNELVGADDPSVTVHHPVLVVNRHESAQNILCPGRRHIIVADVDDCGIVAAKTGINTSADPTNRRTERQPFHIQGTFSPGPMITRWINRQKTSRSLECVTQTHRESLLREGSATSHGAQNDCAVFGQIHMDCCRLIVIKIKEFDIKGQRNPVNGFLIERSRKQIIHIKIETPDYFVRHDTRPHHQDLVIKI